MSQLPDPESVLKRISGSEEATKEDDLPASTIIEIDVAGRQGKRYQGRFLFTIPTLGDQIKIGAIKSVYLPKGADSDPNAQMLVEIVAFLTSTISFNEAHPKPKWWNPLQAYDATPYSDLYRRCLDYEARFHGEGASSRGVEETADEGGSEPRVDTAHVGRKVQTPPERRETLAGDRA